MAQIASEVRRGWCKDPQKVKLSDFLMQRDDSPKQQTSTLEQSKAFWTAVANQGAGSKKTVKPKKPKTHA